MYGKNVGNTLKTLAKITLWVTTGIGVLIGLITLIVTFEEVSNQPMSDAVGRLVSASLRLLLYSMAGFAIGWSSSVILYAFGELIVKVTDIREDLDFLCRVKESEINAEARRSQTMQSHEYVGWRCESCGCMNPVTSDHCLKCGQMPVR